MLGAQRQRLLVVGLGQRDIAQAHKQRRAAHQKIRRGFQLLAVLWQQRCQQPAQATRAFLRLHSIEPGVQDFVVRKTRVQLRRKLQRLGNAVGVQPQADRALGLVALRLAAGNQPVQRGFGYGALARLIGQIGHQFPINLVEHGICTACFKARGLQGTQRQRQIALTQVQGRQAHGVVSGQAAGAQLFQQGDGFSRTPGPLQQLGLHANELGGGAGRGCTGPELPHKRQRGIHRTQPLVHLNHFGHFVHAQAALA